MTTITHRLPLITLLAMAALLLLPVAPGWAEILNDDEFGSLEILDLSVIEAAADMFVPTGLMFNVSRGGPLHPGQELAIYYRGRHECYATLLDYSPDRKVKPLVMNELMRLTEGGLQKEYYGIIGEALGREYILLLVTALPLTDERLEAIALAPNEIEPGDEILSASVNDFEVVQTYEIPALAPDRPINIRIPTRDDMFIELEDFAIYIDYPLNTYPYNPWPYMYLYPYPRFRPAAYINRYGPFTRTWYVFPQGERLKSNFWDYAYAGWIDDGIWVIPPGGYWQGKFRADDPYASYYLRVLPYYIRENQSYFHNLQLEINGTLLEPSIDITGAIGWGEYWTYDPFAYYDLSTWLLPGENTIRLYWPADSEEEFRLQMIDMVPAEVVEEELDAAEEAMPEEEAEQTGEGDGAE